MTPSTIRFGNNSSTIGEPIDDVACSTSSLLAPGFKWSILSNRRTRVARITSQRLGAQHAKNRQNRLSANN